MSYASTSIDRRADYYARSAALIAADPLDFYTRAEKGRRFQASRLNLRNDALVPPQPSTSSPSLVWSRDATASPGTRSGAIAA